MDIKVDVQKGALRFREKLDNRCSHNMLHPFQHPTLIRSGKCCTRLCTKVVDPAKIPALGLFVGKTVYLLKKCMSLAFFDLMEHMLIHLVDNLENCGPIGGRWVYLLEQHMGA